jgi:hypothetical protein
MDAELGFYESASGKGEIYSERRIVKETLDGGGEVRGVVLADKEAGALMEDGFGDTCDAGSDAGCAEGHSLEEDCGEAVAVTVGADHAGGSEHGGR